MKKTDTVHFIKCWSDGDRRHLLGTIFSGGLIRISCSSAYLGQQDDVSKDKLQLCGHGNGETCHSTLWLIDVFHSLLEE